jgi:hypothetical protein
VLLLQKLTYWLISMFTIDLATTEDAEQILALQQLAYQSEAKLYEDWTLKQ